MRSLEEIERAAARTPGVAFTEGWIATEATLAGAGGGPSPGGGHGGGGGGPHRGGVSAAVTGDRFAVLALPLPTRMLALEIVEGRWLLPEDSDGIVVNTAFSVAGATPGVGTRIALQMGPARMTWRVVGVAREPFSQPTAYVPRSFFERQGHAGMVNSVRLSLAKADSGSLRRVRQGLEENLEREGIRAASIQSKSDGRFAFDQHMLMIYVFLIVTSLVLGGVGGLGLMTTMSLSVLERRR